jgi:hypothetical protein
VLPYDDYETTQGNVRARLSALAGLLGVIMAPAAIVISMKLTEVTLIMAVIAIAAVCTVFGAVALLLAKRARRRRSVSLGRMGGAKLAALGRFLGTLTFGLGLAACVALIVYSVMTRL